MNMSNEVIMGVEAEMECKHMCESGDGNEYAVILTNVEDSTTQFLCIPCLVGVAMVIVTAMTEPDDPSVIAAVEAYDAETVTSRGTRGRKASLMGGHAGAVDDGIFDEFEPDVSAA
jgi:hypothetical protein